MGEPAVHQINQFLMRMLNAKKVIDVGVFTGLSALSAALIMPDDNVKILACDISEEYTNIGKVILMTASTLAYSNFIIIRQTCLGGSWSVS